MTWQAGGSIRFGGIIATSKGYLAGCRVDDSSDQLELCSSRDLVTWASPPDPALYVNAGGAPFLPATAVPVKSGYGARAGGTATGRTEWYSADGVHWREGIPAGVQVPGYAGPCVPDPHQSGKCLNLDFIASDSRSPVLLAGMPVIESRAGSDYIFSHMLVSTNGWSTWQEVALPDPLWQMAYGPPQLLPDGTWIGICSVLRPAPPGVAIGGDPPAVFITSKDGLHWQAMADTSSPDSVAVLGSGLFAVFGDGLSQSLDGGNTWLPMKDSAGKLVGGLTTAVVNGRVLVFDGDLSWPGLLLWIGTPSGK